MTISFTFDAHIETIRFNTDWTDSTNIYTTSQITLDVPDGETMFTVGTWGELDSAELADHILHYTTTYGTFAPYLTNDHPVAISQVTHSGGLETTLLQFDIHVRNGDNLIGFDTIYIVLDGDPLPTFANAAEFDAWAMAATGWWTPPDTGAYAPGATPAWSDFAIEAELLGTAGNDRIEGTDLPDIIHAGDGADTIIGGDDDDQLFGGDTSADLADRIYAGAGDDSVDGGYGNDSLVGDVGNDTMAGGFGADTLIGNRGDDVLTGSAFSDLLFGNDGMDFINGGFGYDRVNGGADADRFYHLGVASHGFDWIQDYTAADGDVLMYGGGAGPATPDDFLVQFAETTGAGTTGVKEAFVTHIPSGNVLWALIDGEAQSSINIQINGVITDLLL